jgi:hypothetical protein
MWPNGCTKKERRSSYGYLDFGYVKCWTFNYSSTIKDESGRINSNQAYTFWEWSTREQVVILVQVSMLPSEWWKFNKTRCRWLISWTRLRQFMSLIFKLILEGEDL